MARGFVEHAPAQEIRLDLPRELLNEARRPRRATSSWMRSMPMKLTMTDSVGGRKGLLGRPHTMVWWLATKRKTETCS